MVIGTGLLAKAFEKYADNNEILIFASGVSNSTEKDPNAFLREEVLLRQILKNNPKSLFIYFSTCSIYDETVNSSAYVQHKLKMENIVTDNTSNYLIFRLTNIVGYGGNENTIFNFLVNSIKNNKLITVWKQATRNILGIEDLLKIASRLIDTKDTSQIINIGNIQSFGIAQIIEAIEGFLGIKAKTVLLDKGKPVNIDISKIENIVHDIIKCNSSNYIEHLLSKYYNK